jgi:hypothetical protein
MSLPYWLHRQPLRTRMVTLASVPDTGRCQPHQSSDMTTTAVGQHKLPRNAPRLGFMIRYPITCDHIGPYV